MTWLAPAYVAAGALAALAIVALHLLAWRRPPPAMLPTARFVPDAPARARARSTRPADPWLLALRVLTLLLLSAALARPVRVTHRASLARVVVADRSGSVGDVAAMMREVRAAWREGDALVVVDSVARTRVTPDSVGALARLGAGRLSPALVAAIDAARELGARADSAELVMVSPLLREELDAATPGLARAWAGRARLVRVPPPARAAAPARAMLVDANGDDPVAAGVLAAGTRAAADVRLVRHAATSADSAWLGAAAERVLVTWPVAVAAPDASGAGLAWGDDALVAPIAVGGTPAEGRVVLRWADGSVAATERALGTGCVRDVQVALPRAGDVTLSTAFGRLLEFLATPCGGPRDLTPVDPAALGFRATGAARVLPRPAPRDAWGIARWLLGGAIVLLLAEPLVRRAVAVRDDAARDDAAPGRTARPEAA